MTSFLRPVKSVVLFSVVAALSLGNSIGCSSQPPVDNSLSGKITYVGKDVPAGTITVTNGKGLEEEGHTYTIKIGKDGTYSFSNIPAGNYLVKIETKSIEREAARMERLPKSQDKAGNAPPKIVYVKIPDKYGNATTSGLSVDVPSSGNVTKDFELK